MVLVLECILTPNFAYIGNDYNVDNDANTVIQANEVVATNGAKIFLVQLTQKETLELVINLELIKTQDKLILQV